MLLLLGLYFKLRLFLRLLRRTLLTRSGFLVGVEGLRSDLRQVRLHVGHLRVLGLEHLVQILGAPDWHGLDRFPGAILTLAVDRRLVQHHLPVAALLGHVRREPDELVGVCRTVDVLVHTD